jgi:hypothetical protein
MPQNQRNGYVETAAAYGCVYCILNTYFLKLALNNGYSPEDVRYWKRSAPQVATCYSQRAHMWIIIFGWIHLQTGAWLEKSDSGHVLQSRWAGVTRSIISVTVSQLQLSVLPATVSQRFDHPSYHSLASSASKQHWLAVTCSTNECCLKLYLSIQGHLEPLHYLVHEWVARDRFCGLVVRVYGYRSRGLGFDSRRFQIFWEAAGLERCPLSLTRTTEELLEGKVEAPF